MERAGAQSAPTGGHSGLGQDLVISQSEGTGPWAGSGLQPIRRGRMELGAVPIVEPIGCERGAGRGLAAQWGEMPPGVGRTHLCPPHHPRLLLPLPHRGVSRGGGGRSRPGGSLALGVPPVPPPPGDPVLHFPGLGVGVGAGAPPPLLQPPPAPPPHGNNGGGGVKPASRSRGGCREGGGVSPRTYLFFPSRAGAVCLRAPEPPRAPPRAAPPRGLCLCWSDL